MFAAQPLPRSLIKLLSRVSKTTSLLSLPLSRSLNSLGPGEHLINDTVALNSSSASFALRDYQLKATDQIQSFLAEGKNPLLSLPTGGGKTVVIAELARRAEAGGKRTLTVVPRREILDQTKKALEIVGVFPRIIEAGSKLRHDEQSPMTTIAMIQTLASRQDCS
jgi:superfamily II DNA or RNA helicase